MTRLRRSDAATEAAFLHVLELAREIGLMRLGTVSIDGTKIDANASKYRSIRYDRAKDLRKKLAVDIATLMERAETADATEADHQALPDELARREAVETLQAKGVDPLVAIGRPVDRRPYDFRPEPPPKTPRRITEPWRLKMKARLQHSAIGYVTPNEAEEIFYTILNDGKKAA